MMRKKTRTGNSTAALAVLACALLASAAGKKPEPYAVVAGTVFQENGFSLPGAVVTLLAKGAAKGKKLEAVSDARGEFAFRVAAGAGTYVVKATHKGFQPAEKGALVSGEERVEVTLMLPAESK
jgi:hypothetical protein